MVHENVRRLVLASLGDQEPECGICLETFTHADATVMECAHVACNGCFAQLRKRECPFCRHKFADRSEADKVTSDRSLMDLFGSDSEEDSDSVPRRRGPCRCTLCNQIGHQRNNRRFHPINTLTN